MNSKPPRKPTARLKKPDRFGELNGFIDYTLAGLKGAEIRVWLVLYRDTKADTGIAVTGQTDIARRAGITTRGVGKALKVLIEKGLVQVIRRGRIGAGPSSYQVRGVSVDGVL